MKQYIQIVQASARRALLFVLALAICTSGIQAALAATASAAADSWADGAMPVLELGAETDSKLTPTCSMTEFTYSTYVPETYNGTSRLREAKQPVCAMTGPSGQFGRPGVSSPVATRTYDYVKPNTNYAYKVLSPDGRPTAIVPLAGQKRVMYQPAHSFIAGAQAIQIADSLSAAGDFGLHHVGSPVAYPEFSYKLSSLPPVLRFANNEVVYLRYNQAFSSNGEWMVFETFSGVIRLNIATQKMALISTERGDYSLGFQPSMELAISDDGNTVVKSGFSGGGAATVAYDLSGCQDGAVTPGVLTPGCRSRLLENNISTQLPGFESLFNMRFSGDGQSVSGKVSYQSGGQRRYADMTYSVAGYVAPKTAYLALGDSFSSGEGAYDYELGTDSDNPRNKCHLSKKSYPYLTAQALGTNDNGFHSAACSGAKSIHYYSEVQYPDAPNGNIAMERLPGLKEQKKYIEQAGPDTITISMGGNDVGFSNKVTRCIALADTCFHFREDRESMVYEIHSKFDTLVSLYKDIKRDSKDAKVYVLGYPQLFSTNGSCSLNAPLDAEERQMSRGLVTYLNAVIKSATQKAGVQYIDVENVFADKELCGSDQVKAVNGLTAGNDITLPATAFVPVIGGVLTNQLDVPDVPIAGNESFHPNALGHQLMSQALLLQSQNLTKPMPANSDSTTAPYVGSAAYNNFIGTAPSGGLVKRAVYTVIDGSDALLRGSPVTVNLPDDLKPNSLFEFWFNSTPTYAGSLTSDGNGRLAGEITVPASLPAGYHTLHIYGQNVAGETIDMSRTVYVAASTTDYDGDGVANAAEKCQAVPPSNVDHDKDGIDDACDGEITEPPADATPPMVTGIPDRLPDHGAWYTSDVTINWDATDPTPSSGTPTQPTSTVANAEGNHIYTSSPSCDVAGNCATGSLSVMLDKTEPTIDFTLSSAPTADGWHNGTVTVTFICNDPASPAGAASGIANCSEPVTINNGSTFVTGTVTDRAGRTSGVNVFIAIDSVKPTVSQVVSPAANSAGWHHTDVTITATCNDDLSGIAESGCSPAVALTAEAANQRVTATAIDKAGNTNSATTYINIDKTAPVLGVPSWTGNPKATGQTATLTIPATDNLSGVREAEYFLGDTDPGHGNGAAMTLNTDGGVISTNFGTDFPTGVYKVSYRAKDTAGNWSAATSDYLVVYNPTGVRMTGKNTVIPSLGNGDVLPGLSGANANAAKFGFNVRYDTNGRINAHSDFQFSYRTGSDCNKPAQAQNCHSFDLNAISITWLTTQGANNSTGIFQGTGKLVVDGVASTVLFRLTGVDGEQLNSMSQDRLVLKVYNTQDNPNTATAIYKVEAEVARGNIRIRTE